VLGLTRIALAAVCRNLGLAAAPAANAALLDAATPALILFLAAAALGERHGPRRLAGAGLALIGVLGVGLAPTKAKSVGSLVGDGLLFVSVAAFAAYTVLGQRVGAGGDALALVTGAVGYGLLALLPGAALELAISGLPTPDLGDALVVLYLGAGPSALAFALWGFALARIEAGQAAVIDCLTPLFGLTAAVLLGERLVPLQVAGGVLILCGVWIAAAT
jgi:drug/metabolite transporter (DMT)-like permease